MVSALLFRYSLSNEVHHLALMQATGAAIKAMLDHMDRVLIDWPVEQKVLVIVDFQVSGEPALKDGIPHVITFLRRKTRNPRQQVRLAYMYPPAAQGRILKGFLVIQRFMPQRLMVRFFPDGEEHKALEWLRSW